MEEGTGGRRKGRRRRKETRVNAAAIGNIPGSTCVSPHPSVIYSSFQSSHKIHYSGRDNQSDPPFFLPT